MCSTTPAQHYVRSHDVKKKVYWSHDIVYWSHNIRAKPGDVAQISLHFLIKSAKIIRKSQKRGPKDNIFKKNESWGLNIELKINILFENLGEKEFLSVVKMEIMVNLKFIFSR